MRNQNVVGITKAADLLGVHPNTLRRWADDGAIATVKLPSGHRRFTLAEIARMRREMGMDEPEERATDSARGDF